MRVALVRGPNLNPWELANYAQLDGVVAFGSRRGSFADQRIGLPVRRLASPADVVSRLPYPGGPLVARFGGNVDHLIGLRAAVSGFDVVHTAELSTGYSGQAVRARDAGACRRVVATVWENIPLLAPENPVVARRVAAVAAGVDHCIAVSDDARVHLELAGVPADRIDVLGMGIDLAHFAPGPRVAAAGGALRILSVARLVHEKGVEDLVVAAGLLRRRGTAVQLTLAGDGPLASRLRRLAGELGVALDLPGVVPYEDVPGMLAGADVFVLASAPRTTWREQFGFAIVEAMAAGLPVLAGDSGSLDEVVGDPGQLVRPHDADALAAALGALAQDPDRRTLLGERNRRWAEQRFDRRQTSRRIAAIYDHVLASAPRVSRSGR